jgi:hypothetical protein
MRRIRMPLLILAVLLLPPSPVALARPVAVRSPEGAVQSFLVLRSTDGSVIALGEMRQVRKDDRIESRLTFAFKDGSQHEETTTFSQRDMFRLVGYRVRQRGPSFPTTLDATLDASGQYRVVSREGDAAEKVDEGRLELPADVSNGMTTTLLKNLGKGESETVHVVAFGPKPRVVGLKLGPEGEDPFVVGGQKKTATRYVGKPDLGALGVVARLLGKYPPDYHFWLYRAEPPGFLAAEGPLYPDGPIWRIEVATPTWPSEPLPRS